MGGYYNTDGSVRQCSSDIVRERALRLPNPKHAEAVDSYLRGLPESVSIPNVIHDIIEHKRGVISDKLSVALANRSPEVPDLLKEYGRIGSEPGEASEMGSSEILDFADTSYLEAEPQENEALIQLWPKSLNNAVGGGAKRGHQILVFARPEAGKTLVTLNLVAGFLHQELRVLYVGNEEPVTDLRTRLTQRILKLSKAQVLADRVGAAKALDKRLRGTLFLAGLAPGTFPEIERHCDKLEPDVVVLDQLRNIRVQAGARVEELEAAATAARNLAKRRSILVVSVTQAGDSATNKIYLDLNDVDSSKTGIPAQMDLMIGVGSNQDMQEAGMLGFSLCKNKLSGEHARFTVSYNKQTGVITSGGSSNA